MVLTGSAAGDTFLVPEPPERHTQRMLFHTLPGYTPRLRWTEADDAVEADDDPPGSDGQKDDGEPVLPCSAGSPRLTSSDLKKLCLICGDIREEDDEEYNKIENLEQEVDIVFR